MSRPSKPVAVAVCTALAGGIALTGSAFAMQPLAQGYMLAPSAGEPQAAGDKEGKRDLASYDTDGDGRISRAEFTAAHPDKADKFDRIDANQDGFIDQAEHAAKAKGKEGTCGGDKKHAEGKCGGSA